jgi:hypothetical protein
MTEGPSHSRHLLLLGSINIRGRSYAARAEPLPTTMPTTSTSASASASASAYLNRERISNAQIRILTSHATLLAADLKPATGPMGIHTPDVHPHGFASKGIDPVQLKSAIAAATKAAPAAPNAEERKLNDFGASPVERFNAAHPLYVTPVTATASANASETVATDGEWQSGSGGARAIDGMDGFYRSQVNDWFVHRGASSLEPLIIWFSVPTVTERPTRYLRCGTL